MIPNERWTKNWNPEVHPGLNRVVMFEQFRTAIDQAWAWGKGQPIQMSVVFSLVKQNVLTSGQIGTLLGISRAYVYMLAKQWRDFKGMPYAPRGLLEDYGIDLMFLLVKQLQLGYPPSEDLLAHLPFCGDIAIVSYLTGVPKSVINRYRVTKEEQDGADHRQRVADAARVHERAQQ